MQLAHVPGAIAFAVHISLHVSEAEPAPDHPMHMLKLDHAKSLGMSSSSLHPTFVPTA